LMLVATWVVRVQRSRGSWERICAAGSWTAPTIIGRRPTPVERAWWRICQLRRRFAEAAVLEQLDIVMDVAGGERLPRDRAEVEQLRAGLDRVTVYLRSERRGRRRAA